MPTIYVRYPQGIKRRVNQGTRVQQLAAIRVIPVSQQPQVRVCFFKSSLASHTVLFCGTRSSHSWALTARKEENQNTNADCQDIFTFWLSICEF